MPLDDPLYKASRFIEYSNREKCSFDDLTELLSLFLGRFGNYIQDPYQLDSLEQEYLTYQSMSDMEIPEGIWEKSLVKVSEERIYHPMDIIWGNLRTFLPKLANIALFFLTILHSTPGEERIFSMIAKNKTKFRSSLDNKKSLNSIMFIKMNKRECFKPCYQ